MFRLLTQTVAFSLIFVGCARFARCEESEQQVLSAKSRQLIEQLGDSAFSRRQLAVQKLREIGLPALPALREALKHRDLEVRVRARSLMHTVERLDHEHRIQVFLDDPQKASADLLPGLKRYRKIVGSEADSARLFADMQRKEAELFLALKKTANDFTADFELRCIEMQYQYSSLGRRSQIAGRVAALIFLAADPEIHITENSANVLNYFMQCNEFRTALSSQTFSRSARKLMSAWISKPNSAGAYQKIMLAMRYNLPGGLVPALEIVKGNAAAGQVQYAILAVGKFGNRKHLPALKTLRDNFTVVGISRVSKSGSYVCQVRDVAMAVQIHLWGQDPKRFGFTRIQKHSQYLLSPNTAGFRNSQERQTAIDKWDVWKTSQTKKANSSKSKEKT